MSRALLASILEGVLAAHVHASIAMKWLKGLVHKSDITQVLLKQRARFAGCTSCRQPLISPQALD